MSWVQRTLIVTAANAALARRICKDLTPAGSGNNMFLTGLSASGALPATHYISSGLIQDNFGVMLGNAAGTFGACQQVPSLADVTLAQIQALYTSAVISVNQDPFVVLAANNLKVI